MDTIEIYWFIFFICAALWGGAKSGNAEDIAWLSASIFAGILTVLTAHSIVVAVFNWLTNTLPSPTSPLNPITAGILTLILCAAFVFLLSLTATTVSTFVRELPPSKTKKGEQ